jgi:hypothetical protein
MLLVALAGGLAAVEEHLRHQGANQAKPTAVEAVQPPQPAPPVAADHPTTHPSPPEVQAPAQPVPPERPAQPDPEANGANDANAANAARGTHDPWREPVPRSLQAIRNRITRGAHLSPRALAPAYAFARKNPNDPRPWLLLGAAYAQADWFSDAVQRYVRAYQVDPTCRADPQMLANLVKAAAHPVAGRSGARAIRDIYGAEAIPALEQALEQHRGDRDATARLTRLRESLPH